ncbi:hypothetical protein GCM10027612_08090 [Microbispora bryophytorum subsp. camponoti]
MGEVTDQIVEVLLKALAGGVFVLAFAALAETLTPKRLAGVFCAAPSVALASLIVTAGIAGVPDVLASARGMQVGAVGFALYCLITVPLVRRWGVWRGRWPRSRSGASPWPPDTRWRRRACPASGPRRSPLRFPSRPPRSSPACLPGPAPADGPGAPPPPARVS